jgi:hypothetical protein
MKTIGSPPRPAGEFDVPLAAVEQDLADRKQQLAAALEQTRTALLAAGHPDEAHAWLDADPDTAWPLPGVAHPKTAGGQS